MAQEYYKLKDKGTSFHDHSQDAKVVSTRIGFLHNTPIVIKAVKQNILVKVTDADMKGTDFKTVKDAYDAQEADLKALRAKQVESASNKGKPNVIVNVSAPAADAETGKGKKGGKAKLDDLDAKD